MKPHWGRVGLLVGVILLSIRPAAADPVRITSGYLDMGSTAGSLLLLGEGFLLSGGVTVNDGVFQPWLQCRLGPSCVPGASLDLNARWAGSGLRSTTATVRGEDFRDVGGANSITSASVNFAASGIAPIFVGETATLIVPFLFQGEFIHFNASFQRLVESLSGEGTVTMTLQRNASLATWNYVAAKYDFQPVPEPATILLTAAGVTTLLAHRRRRRHQQASTLRA
jgi:hypothetical protein